MYSKKYLAFVFSMVIAGFFELFPFFYWLKDTGHELLILIVVACIMLVYLIYTAGITKLLKLQLWAVLIGIGTGVLASFLLAFPENLILPCASISMGIACVLLPGWIAGKRQTGLFVVYRFPFTNRFIIARKERCARENQSISMTAEILSVKRRLKKGRVYIADMNRDMFHMLKHFEEKGVVIIWATTIFKSKYSVKFQINKEVQTYEKI